MPEDIVALVAELAANPDTRSVAVEACHLMETYQQGKLDRVLQMKKPMKK